MSRSAPLSAFIVAAVTDHVIFPGHFAPADLSLRERAVARLGGASEGDYRDWDTVRAWADAKIGRAHV